MCMCACRVSCDPTPKYCWLQTAGGIQPQPIRRAAGHDISMKEEHWCSVSLLCFINSKMWISNNFWQNLKCTFKYLCGFKHFYHVSILARAQLFSSPKCLCCLEHWKKSFVLMWRSCGFVNEEQKTPMEPECRVECMPPPPPRRPVTKMLND